MELTCLEEKMLIPFGHTQKEYKQLDVMLHYKKLNVEAIILFLLYHHMEPI